ncbi:hypothetical protein Q5P01_013917 [Channa striata]|uniref:C-type lectin domain-containing protein n=1 Tax=Channa striata TaxID=64152 RepID=A0AA88SIA5_CHASR|nr:hypothetical protein Q5P01_013917 [Channa striata]
MNSIFYYVIYFSISDHNLDPGSAADFSLMKNNLTQRLQASDNKLSDVSEERDRLKTRVSSLTAERDQLKTRVSSLTAEKDQLKTRVSSLTAERDRLNITLIKRTKELNSLQSSSDDRWTVFSGSCYIVSSRSDSWTNARRDCQNKGADLVVINSAQKQNFLSGFSNVDTWIGLSDRDEEGRWKWVDGSPLTLKNWNDGEPNNKPAETGEDCAQMELDKVHKWNDLHCDKPLRWICEKSA